MKSAASGGIWTFSQDVHKSLFLIADNVQFDFNSSLISH